jgi:zinc transport system substrate-binding protein
MFLNKNELLTLKLLLIKQGEKMKKTTLLILMIALVLMTACTQPTKNDEELLIITSAFPLYEFAREIAPSENIKMLVPPGVDVHHYDLKPSDLILLDQADLIIFIGEEMEPWLEKILEEKHNDKIIQATKKVQLLKSSHDDHEDELEHLLEQLDHIIHEWEDGDISAEEALEEIDELIHEFEHIHEFKYDNANNDDYEDELEHLLEQLDYIIHEWEDGDISAEEALEEIEELIHTYESLSHSHSEYDPHVWLDFENNIELVNVITTRLSVLNPEQSQEYRVNADAYITKLRELDRKYSEGLENCEIREFITNHDSFEYLAQRYDLKQIPIRGLSAEQEPSPKTISLIIEEAKEHSIQHVFFEELASPRVSDALAKEIGAQTLMLTPGENIPVNDWGKKTFIDLMNENLENLKIGLRCN